MHPHLSIHVSRVSVSGSGSGFRISNSGLRGLESGVWILGIWVQGTRLRVLVKAHFEVLVQRERNKTPEIEWRGVSNFFQDQDSRGA